MKGRPLSADFRASIIDEILRNGGDIHAGYFPGRLEDVAKRFKVSRSCVKNLWGVCQESVLLNQGVMAEEILLI